MSELTRPSALLLVACLVVVVVGLNLSLIGLLRSSRRGRTEVSPWSRVLMGMREAPGRQNAQLDELHRAVMNLKSTSSAPGQAPDHDAPDGDRPA